MKKRIVWLVVSGLMALSLVVTSCAPKVTEEEEVVTEEKVVTEKEVVTEEKKEVVAEKEVVAKKEVPQYGGVLNFVWNEDPVRGFSYSSLHTSPPTWYVRVTNEQLLVVDRTKGPGGSGQWTGLYNIPAPFETIEGNLAESFEVIQPDILKLKIRKGIRWQNRSPTYGAEFTAEDVVYTYMVAFTRTRSAWPRLYPYLSNMKNPAESVYVDPNDPWTVVFKAAPGLLMSLFEHVTMMSRIFPKALGPIEGEGFVDWKGVVGTGPFLLTDYVMGSSMTWLRNPNYWKKDRLHPENQLPYLDGVKMFIISDQSTQFAALRTGKIDLQAAREGITSEDAEALIRTSPQLRWAERWGGSPLAVHIRVDKAPGNDIRVRRALMLAIDHDELVRDYYGGKANKFVWPAAPIPEHAAFYVPLEEMPESVQELYGYNPDKAKQLLKEAGYPDGFTYSVIVNAAQQEHIDMAAVIKSYWAKVGVTLNIEVKEAAVHSAMGRARTFEHGFFDTIAQNAPMWFFKERVGSVGNYANINEPLVENTMAAVRANYFDSAEMARIIKEATPDLINLVLHQKLPQLVVYTMWQPWLKGYYGEEFPVNTPVKPQPASEYI